MQAPAIDSCDPATGCVYTPVICDDGNPCTEDTCDPAVAACIRQNCDDGNLCTEDRCDPVLGCLYTPVNCDDGDVHGRHVRPASGCVYAGELRRWQCMRKTRATRYWVASTQM